MARRSELAETLVELLGMDAAKILVRDYGGKQIKVPDGSGRAGNFSQWMDEALGKVAADRLRSTFGGEVITIPRLYDQMLNARNRLIVADYDQGLGMVALVRQYGLTERQIRTILNRPLRDAPAPRVKVDDSQMALF